MPRKKKNATEAESGPEEQSSATSTSDADVASDRPERFIVFLRHGVAEERREGKPDEERSLTKEGHSRVRQYARGLARLFPKAEAIYSSPLVRCLQTSLWVVKAYDRKIGVKTTEALSPSGKSADVLRLIDELPEKRLILVGHEPTLTKHMMTLTRIKSQTLELKKGGLYGVRIQADGTATLDWVLPPRVLRRL